MRYTNKQMSELRSLCEAVALWLQENSHPHMTITISQNSCELSEGVFADPDLLGFASEERQYESERLVNALEKADYNGWSDVQIDAFIAQIKQSLLGGVGPMPDMPEAKHEQN